MGNPYGSITDVPGIQVGQAQRIGDGWLSGVTVVVPPDGTVGAVDVRGGGPGTQDTDILAPGTISDLVHAVVLTGGSAYGLASVGGVQRWCEEQGRGLSLRGTVVVPIVPGAVVFDVGRGGEVKARPDAAMGYEAVSALSTTVDVGVVGAGTGTQLANGTLKGGIGTASIRLGGVTVGAIVAANAAGSPVNERTGELLAAPYVPDDALRPGIPSEHPLPQEPPSGRDLNTTLAVVATDAKLTRPEARRMAMTGHDGLARAVRPVHTLADGDAVFGLATGTADPAEAAPEWWPEDRRLGGIFAIQAASADVVTLAFLHAVLAATSVRTPAAEIPAYLDRYPSAQPISFRRTSSN
ncbi:P1 family peptidase [Tenggerimyces flavus]|uniref:P1 family peptidase n=1 Tax=Tenggerimyces flavus TaxID=1708749 RepID=A0ABV7YSB7_9ACTN|nr:P1 family peptidase [Tenggerimyces flavus]MBM7785923.1 putative pantetheine hydrolase [Tenggerimyces flavus]